MNGAFQVILPASFVLEGYVDKRCMVGFYGNLGFEVQQDHDGHRGGQNPIMPWYEVPLTQPPFLAKSHGFS